MIATRWMTTSTALALTVILPGCSDRGGPAPASASPASAPAASAAPQGSATTDSPKQFQEGIKKPGAILVDVRTPDEYADGHIEGALNIDWNGTQFQSDAGKLDKSKPVYVYCGVGARSARAMAAMQRLGFRELHNLGGGLMAWREAGLPLGK